MSARPSQALSSLGESLASHWPEYLMEAAGLGAFMISACLFGALLEHPASPVRASITDGTVRRVLGGVLMGLTAIAIIYSRWGKRSGAHINPAVTLTFLRLGKIRRPDAIFYILAQFGGGLAGVVLSAAVLGSRIADPAVNYAVTVPGPDGTRVAFIAEALISFFLMGVILTVSNSVRWNRFTGLFAGFLVATYIGLEGPLSGMSMNPARTLASALPGGVWTDFWIYFVAPPLGMLLAAEAYLRLKGAGRILCAKLHHRNEERCIFRCGFQSCGESS